MLTKTDYVNFLACPNEFWMSKNVEQDGELTLQQTHLRQQGYDVERLARQMSIFKPSGNRKVAFAHVFESGDLYAKVDILVTNNADASIEIYEVKSNASVKPEHIEDAAFQKHVAELAKYKVAKVFIITVNSSYVRNGDICADENLKITDVTDDVIAVQADIHTRIAAALAQISTEPVADIAVFCGKKLDCGFIRQKFPDIPEYNVSHISRISLDKLKDLLKKKILDVKDVPDDFALTDNQRQQVNIARSAAPTIKSAEIKAEVKKLEFPLHFLDYETFSFAIPHFEGIRPYQQLVFQFSLHTLREPVGELEHAFGLSRNDGEFPSLHIARQLKEAFSGGIGTVMSWHAQFERDRNKEMSAMHPDYAEMLEEINAKTFDLESIFKAKLYLDGGFLGKTSIKSVLPILCPKHSYKEMDIGDGTTASIRWYHMATGRGTAQDRDETYESLKKYCELDTLAMVEIYRILASIA